MSAPAPQVVLLGPQQIESTVGTVLRELGVVGPVALVTAGWQEREAEDAALITEMGVPGVNLRLHARSQEVFAADDPLRIAYSARQELLRHVQDFYRVRLDYTDDAARAISVRHVEPELLEDERKVSITALRQLDQDHVERCRAIHVRFDAEHRLAERPVVARHRDELRALIAPAGALVIAGGHVASLLNRMKLFDVLGLAAGLPIVAWSAGAMVLTERIVLFHDHPPYGKDIAQVLDEGFGVAPRIVVLPDPRRRIRTDDSAGIARFAMRMAPAACVAMDHGARVTFAGDRIARAAATLLTTTGQVDRWNA